MPVLDGSFEAFVTNLGKYNEGELVGEWVKFPTTAEELKKYPHKKIMSSLEELLEREPLPAAASPRNISVRRIALLLLLFAAFAAFFCFLIFI